MRISDIVLVGLIASLGVFGIMVVDRARENLDLKIAEEQKIEDQLLEKLDRCAVLEQYENDEGSLPQEIYEEECINQQTPASL